MVAKLSLFVYFIQYLFSYSPNRKKSLTFEDIDHIVLNNTQEASPTLIHSLRQFYDPDNIAEQSESDSHSDYSQESNEKESSSQDQKNDKSSENGQKRLSRQELARPANLLRRESLRFEPEILQILKLFWKLIDSNRNGVLDKGIMW